MKFAPSKLFHAVVISGAALTGCAGTSQKPTTPAPGDTNAVKDTGPSQAVETSGTGTCPPGSERPYPPCYWIK
jgi:hypothetical protein